MTITFVLLSIFILSLLLPISTSIVGYNVSLEALRRQTNEMQMLTLKRVQSQEDAYFNEIYSQMRLLSSSESVLNASAFNKEATVTRARALSDCRQTVQVARNLLPFNNMDLVVFLTTSNLFVTAEGLIKEEAYPYYFSHNGLKEEDIIGIHQQRAYRGSKVLYTESGTCMIVLWHHIYDESRKKAGTVYAYIPYVTIENAMMSDIVYSGSILSLADQNGVYLGTNAPSLSQSDMQRISSQSTVLPLQYIYEVPEKNLRKELYNIQLTDIVLIATGFLFGIVLFVLVAKYSEKQAIGLLKEIIPEAGRSRTIGDLRSNINDASREKSLLVNAKKNSDRIRAEKLLADRLEKGIDDDNILLFNLRELDAPILPLYRMHMINADLSTCKDKDQFMGMLKNLGGFPICSLQYTIILIPPESTPDAQQSLFDSWPGAREIHIASCVDLLGIPSLHTGLNIGHQVLDFLAFWYPHDFYQIDYQIKDGQTDDTQVWKQMDIMFYRKLETAISGGNYDTAWKTIRETLESGFGRTARTIMEDTFFAHGLVSVVYDMLKTRVPEQDISIVAGSSLRENLLGQESYPDIYDTIEEIFSSLIRLQDSRRSNTPKWLQPLKEEIWKRYMEPDLSVSSLADLFGLNPPYMSHTFKKSEGIGILDYIHQLRLTEAKKLLSNGCNVREAAERTGYINTQSLIRAFKRYEGITPGQYSSMKKETESE